MTLALLVVSQASAQYQPTPENIEARKEFSDSRFGVFIHWGIYSMFAQGEWYLQNAGLDHREYADCDDNYNTFYYNMTVFKLFGF